MSKYDTAVSIYDPDAIEKLKVKLERFEAQYNAMREVNAYFLKHRTLDGCPSISLWEAAQLTEKTGGATVPYSKAEMDNIGGSVRYYRKRIAELQESKVTLMQREWTFSGGKVVINTELNRVQILFDGERQSIETIVALKHQNFRLVPLRKAWERMLTKNAIAAAEVLTEKFRW